jgi:hypothetical protein
MERRGSCPERRVWPSNGDEMEARPKMGTNKSDTPAERSLRARMAAHLLHAKYDSKDLTASARAAFNERFEHEVDPERILPEDERKRRADHARRAYFTRLALASAKARARRSGDDDRG